MKFPPEAAESRSGFKHFKRMPYGSRWIMDNYRIIIKPPPGYQFRLAFDGCIKLAWLGEPPAGEWMMDPANRWQWALERRP